MQLRARPSPLIRNCRPNQLRNILVADPCRWPFHIQLSANILRDELTIAPGAVRDLIGDALRAAYDCAHRLNERARAAELYARSRKVKAAFKRLFHCAERAPAKLRRLLDENIPAVLESGVVDLEVIESLVQTSRAIFEQFPNVEAARTALSALGIDREYREYGYDATALLNDFLSLSPTLQENCKLALSRAMGRVSITAAAVFKALADGISGCPRPPRGASDIVTDYVTAVAVTWRGHDLHPGRAFKNNDVSYTSKFHRFCDLVLMALVEPDSRRHSEGLDQVFKDAWARQRRLPREDQKYVRGGLPRKESQWLVTAHCLREGLRVANSKKTARDSI
jgi:hypothetical protein